MAQGSPPSAPRTISVPVRSAHMRELVGRGGAERVTGGEQDRAPGGGLAAGELADGRRLADAVHADDEPDVGRALLAVEAELPARGRLQQVADGVAERGEEVVAASHLFGLDLGAQVGQERVGGGDADVGTDEGLFERVPRVRIDATGPYRRDGAAEQPAHAAEAAAVRGWRLDDLGCDDGVGLDDCGLGGRRCGRGRCGCRRRRRLGRRLGRRACRRLGRRRLTPAKEGPGGTTATPPCADEANRPGADAQDGHHHDDDDVRPDVAGEDQGGHADAVSLSFSTFWLTTWEEPPGAIVTP